MSYVLHESEGAGDILVGQLNIHQLMYYCSPLLTRGLKYKLSFGIISSLRVLPVYKTNCLCSILFWDIFLDLYTSIYAKCFPQSPVRIIIMAFN